MTTPDTTTVGYIGLHHHHAEPYLETLAQLPVELVAVCEPDRSIPIPPIEEHGQPATYRDPIELLEEEQPDAVWITLSNRETPEIIEAAIERGIDVYTEKPGGRTAADLAHLPDLARERDATVAVSYTWRAHPAVDTLSELATQGFFGDLRALEARFVASQIAYRDSDHHLFDADESRGGILQWLGVHWIDLLPWLFDDPIARVNAHTTARTDEVDVEDGAVIQFELASGAPGTINCGYYLREGRYDTYLGITGMDGRAAWDPMGDYFGFEGETTLELEAAASSDGSAPRRFVTYDYEPTPGYGGAFGRSFMEQFLEARRGATVDVPPSLTDAVSALRVLDACYASAETGDWVTVDGTVVDE